MNTTIDSKTSETKKPTHAVAPSTTRSSKTVTKRPAPQHVAPAEPVSAKRPASELTRLVFMALLGFAACFALAGVLTEANETGTSPDDPPPAVIGG